MLTILIWDNIPVVVMLVCSHSVSEVEIKVRAKKKKKKQRFLTTTLNIIELL